MIVGDIYDIENRIKNIDDGFELKFDNTQEKYIITHNEKYFMSIPCGELHGGVLNHIQKMVYLNKEQKILEELDKHNKLIEQEEEKKISNMAESIAKDIRKPLVNSIYY